MDLKTDFAFRFFNQVYEAKGGEKPNLFISPLSAAPVCLPMIANGRWETLSRYGCLGFQVFVGRQTTIIKAGGGVAQFGQYHTVELPII